MKQIYHFDQTIPPPLSEAKTPRRAGTPFVKAFSGDYSGRRYPAVCRFGLLFPLFGPNCTRIFYCLFVCPAVGRVGRLCHSVGLPL